MNDLISRRKAFEYFVTLWECIGTIMDRDEWEDVCMTTANEIPSTQPEIIYCKDCKFWKKYGYINEKLEFLPKCGFNQIYTSKDDFCSRAERKNNG